MILFNKIYRFPKQEKLWFDFFNTKKRLNKSSLFFVFSKHFCLYQSPELGDMDF
jgi:hypothetical protein